jgi:hypothetical protein
MSLSPDPANSGGGPSWPACGTLGASEGSCGDDSVSKEVLGAGGTVTSVSEGLGHPLVKKGWEAKEVSEVAPLAVGSGPSLGPLCVGQWLLHLSEGTEVCTKLQNLLGAEYAETTDRSEEDSRRPVSTSVS